MGRRGCINVSFGAGWGQVFGVGLSSNGDILRRSFILRDYSFSGSDRRSRADDDTTEIEINKHMSLGGRGGRGGGARGDGGGAGAVPEEPAAVCRKLIMLKWTIQADKFMSVLIKAE